MSAKLIKIRTIVDFFLLNSNLTKDILTKQINRLIKIHNAQVEKGKLSEDIMEHINTAEQLLSLKETRKRAYEVFSGTEYERIMKARYRERGNYTYIAYEMHMSQGKYYYMMNKVYDFFIKELYKNGFIRCKYGDESLKVINMFFGRVKKVIFKEGSFVKSYSNFEINVQDDFLLLRIHERIIQFVF
ncbi:TPA: hypothetical protein IAC10_07820 [Candidatus Scatousia excrementigallinarum]|uniref:Uncharacterized protein n=1 Tax=Candidatus Scatousia excrementigallinarum TaxID=2840935 RepID=A0A9D1EYW1_9BACT|nr:hypothetical protein [Candidatus Scatousia excrementigallinarum]